MRTRRTRRTTTMRILAAAAAAAAAAEEARSGRSSSSSKRPSTATKGEDDEEGRWFKNSDIADSPTLFINDAGADLPDEEEGRRLHRPSILMGEDQEDVDEIERQVYERYAKSSHVEYGDDATEVEQQALLPSVKDPKLWMVKCAIGHERETAICLMQKFIDRADLQIKSAIALDHLKNYIYVEAEKEAHVKEACKGLRNIYSSAKIMLVPIKEMTDVLSVESKSVDLARDTWVRMKIGIYKGDLAKVVDVDNVRQRVTVKLIPRVDLQTLANKLEGRDIGKKKTFVPPPRFFNIDEAREMRIRVERRRDRDSGEYFEMVDGLMFKDGFLYKTVSFKSISSQNIQPTFDELEKFRKPGDDVNGDVASLSTLFANRKKGHFMKGDAVIVVRGDLKNLEGWVEKVEEDTVHIRPKMPDLPKTLAFNEKELCKYFKPGDHVKVVSGVQEGATGMVVKVEGHVLIILSDTTKEHIRVFADHVVESSEITTGVTRIGDYELHDLVMLDNMSFGVIIRVESEAFQASVPDRPEVVLIKLREIKSKIDRRTNAKDRSNNIVSVKDVVRVIEGPCKGKQGPVEHIHKGILFIYDRHHLEHAGFICAKAQSCVVVGGSNRGHGMNGVDALDSRFGGYRAVLRRSPVICARRAGFTDEDCHRDEISDTPGAATPFRESRFASGSETPMHPSRTATSSNSDANERSFRDIGKKKTFVPPPRFFNIDEAREMRIRVERRRDRDSGEYFEMVDGLIIIKSISSQNIQPTFDELEKFRKPGDDVNGDVASLSTLFANRKKGHFMKGDAVIVVRGDLKNLEGWVEKVEEDTVHIRPKMPDLPKTLAFNEKELCKYFKPGDHVKVVSGVQEGATGMIVYFGHVVESSEITTGVTRIGDYELHDLVLKGVPDRPEVVLIKLREIKSKIDRRTNAKDRSNNIVSVKDVVRVIEGPCKGKQGPVEHIHKGILFIYDRHHLEHAGFICAKAQSCVVVGGSNRGHGMNGVDALDSRFGGLRSSSNVLQSPRRLPPRGPPTNFGGRFGGGRFGGGRGHDSLVGRCIKIKSGPFKGYRGRVKEITSGFVRVELDSQMKIVTVKRDEISDTPGAATPFRESRFASGSETPMHPSRTPLHPIQTPMRDPSGQLPYMMV
ncbi:putative transcription elongation factor SPT 1 [Ananas comosus]|uniref:Putative transcription elongation factor SPT 1 n=1 Tax=Ananas comosus TaxID=4615 RepID=A0A199VVN5_ANACO|nr:putative transcription elongation factor SPT 1 [Ananas comosus]